MKNKTFAITLSILLSAIFIMAATAIAEDIKARMKARLPIIAELKDRGIIGETFTGYLAFLGNKKEKEDVIAAENSDREKVYAAIAKQQGTTAELVGKRRALQIAQKAKPGEWLEDAKGQWYQKQ